MAYEACIRWELKVIGDSSISTVTSTARKKRTLNSRRTQAFYNINSVRLMDMIKWTFCMFQRRYKLINELSGL